MSPVGIQNACTCALLGEGYTSWSQRCWCGTIANTFSQYPGRDSQGLVLNTFSAVTTDVSLSVPSSTNDHNNSRWQSREICQVLSTGAFTLFCHMYDGTMGSSLSAHACLLPPHVRKSVLSSFFVILVLTRLSARCFPSSRPDTASFRSCL